MEWRLPALVEGSGVGLSGGAGTAPVEASSDFIDGRRRVEYNFVKRSVLAEHFDGLTLWT